VTAPLSYDRVLSALRYLFPWETTITRPAGVAPAVGDTKIGRELGTLAWIAARANDRVEAVLAEVFPDTSDESLARWEFITRTATNESLTITQRRARVLSVLRRSGGVQLDRLAAMLYGVLGLTSPNDVQFQETTRAQIDAGLTIESDVMNVAIPAGGSPLVVGLSAPYPGFVDDYGVQVYIQVSAIGSPVVLLESPDRLTAAGVTLTAAAGYYEHRVAFFGKQAAGEWRLHLTDSSGGKTLTRWAIRVSNDVDSGQIYNFFAYRDMGLPGTPDLLEAQRLFNRSALGHMSPSVITKEEFVVDDSLVDREPVA
jgi:uncharacterized protein YmfQ (DUF2313 family)